MAIWRIFRRSPLSEEKYPNRNPAWKQALLIIDFQGFTRKGSSTSLSGAEHIHSHNGDGWNSFNPSGNDYALARSAPNATFKIYMPQYNMTNYNKAVTGKVRSINGTIIPYKPGMRTFDLSTARKVF
ncbi:hypothetical protein N9E87_01565 [Schleiferiaceae bacterium]|nr:hypothetical protein [Schleiferiaceae bacterium]